MKIERFCSVCWRMKHCHPKLCPSFLCIFCEDNLWHLQLRSVHEPLLPNVSWWQRGGRSLCLCDCDVACRWWWGEVEVLIEDVFLPNTGMCVRTQRPSPFLKAAPCFIQMDFLWFFQSKHWDVCDGHQFTAETQHQTWSPSLFFHRTGRKDEVQRGRCFHPHFCLLTWTLVA